MKVAQSSLTVFDPVDCSPSGSSVHGILQARIPEWLQPFPSPGDLPKSGMELGSPALQADSLLSELQGRPKPKVNMKSLSHVRLFVTPWTVAYQAPLPMGFSRQEYWGRLPFPSPGDLSDPGIEPGSPTL